MKMYADKCERSMNVVVQKLNVFSTGPVIRGLLDLKIATSNYA